MDEKIILDLDNHLSNLKDLRLFIDKVYYNQQFANIFNQLALSMADQAVEFAYNILKVAGDKYRKSTGGA